MGVPCFAPALPASQAATPKRPRHAAICSVSGLIGTTQKHQIKTADGALLQTHHTPAAAPPSKRTAILLHDFMTDNRLYSRLTPEIQAISPSTTQVSYEQRGFGGSSLPKGSYNRLSDLSCVASQYAAPYHLLATGLGGAIALQHALHNPQAISSVTVIGSALPGHRWKPDAFLDVTEARRAAQRFLAARDRGYDDVEGETSRDLVKWKQAFIAQSGTWGDVLKNGDKEVARSLLQMAKDYRGFHFFREELAEPNFYGDEPLLTQLGAIQVPILALVGERDTSDFRSIANEVWEGVPIKYSSGPVLVRDAGHFAVLERPVEVAAVVTQFWEAVENGELQ